jgi:site-specific DNA-adenine methylase
MSEELLRRLFDTKRSLPVVTPQTIQLLQSIIGIQQPDNQRRSPASQASRFANLQQPSRGNLFITGNAPFSAQGTLSGDSESSFSITDLSPDQRQIILERARQEALEFNDFLTRRNPQSLYADITGDDKAEMAFRQMFRQVKPVAQFVQKNQSAKTPESSGVNGNADRVQAAKQSPQSSRTDKVEQALSRAAATVTSRKQSGTNSDTRAKSTTKNTTTSQGEYKPSSTEELLRRYFEEYKAAGNIPEANKYAIELHDKYGWSFGSVRAKDPNGGFYGIEWPYIKPPGSQGIENQPSQGTEAFVNRRMAEREAQERRQRIREKQEAEQRERLKNRSAFSKMLDPALPLPTTEIIPALTDMGEGAMMGFTAWGGDRVAGLGRLLEDAEDIGWQVANEVRRNFINDPHAAPPQPTISGRQATLGESIRESGQKAANDSREYIADFGHSTAFQIGAVGAELIPDLVLSTATGNPALTFGISSGVASYGQGSSLPQAALTGVVNARGMKGGNVLAGQLERGITNKFGKYLARSAVLGAQNIGTTAATHAELPDTPQKAAREILFALGFGIFPAGHPETRRAAESALAIAHARRPHPAIRAEIIKALEEYKAAGKTPVKAPTQSDAVTPIHTSPVQTLPESKVATPKFDARKAIADKRSKDQARQQQWQKESESSTYAQNNSRSKTAHSDAAVNSGKSLLRESTSPDENHQVLPVEPPPVVVSPPLNVRSITFDDTAPVHTRPMQTLPESTADTAKFDARKAVADKRSRDEAQRQQWQKELESSTYAQNDSWSKTTRSDTPPGSDKNLTRKSINPQQDTGVSSVDETSVVVPPTFEVSFEEPSTIIPQSVEVQVREPFTVIPPSVEVQPTVQAANKPTVNKQGVYATPEASESIRQKTVAEPEIVPPKAVAEPEIVLPQAVIEPENRSLKAGAESEIEPPKAVLEPETASPVEDALQATPVESKSAKTTGETLSFKILRFVRSPLSGYVGNKRGMLSKGAYDGIIPVSRRFTKIVDVFGGSGLLSNAIQWQLKIPRLLNDADADIVNFHKVAQENSSALRDILRNEESLILGIVKQFPKGGVEAHDAVQKYWKAMKARLSSGNEIAKAALTTILNNGALAVMGRGQRLIQGELAKNKFEWRFSKKTFRRVNKQLDQHEQSLVDTEIVNLDARKILKNAQPNELTLVDPPYVQHADRKTAIADYKEGKDLTTLEGALDFINKDIAAAAQRGVPIIYTNNAHDAIMQALKSLGFETKIIEVGSQGKGGKRGTREEVIAWNDPVRESPTGGRRDSAEGGIRESEPGRLDNMDERTGPRQIPSAHAAPEGVSGSDGIRQRGRRGREVPLDQSGTEETSGKGNSKSFISKDLIKTEPETLKKNTKDKRSEDSLEIEDWAYLSKIAAREIEAGTGKFADFSKRMAKVLGKHADDVKPYLRRLYNQYHRTKINPDQLDNQTTPATRIPKKAPTNQERITAGLQSDRRAFENLIAEGRRIYQSHINNSEIKPWPEIEKKLRELGGNFLANRRRLIEIKQTLAGKYHTKPLTQDKIQALSREGYLLRRRIKEAKAELGKIRASLRKGVKR